MRRSLETAYFWNLYALLVAWKVINPIHQLITLAQEFQQTYSMNPQRKKRLFGFLGRSRSNPHLPERRPSEIETSSLPPSQDESRRGPPGPVCKFFRKVIKGHPASSTQKLPHPEPAAAGSSIQPVPPSQTTQDSSLIVPAPNQASDSRAADLKHLDPTSMKEILTDAARGLGGMNNISGTTQNIASTSNILQTVPGAIDTLSGILGPLKTFNSIANGLADVQAPIYILSIPMFRRLLRMRQMILDQAVRDDAVDRLLKKISEVYELLMEGEQLASIASKLEICTKIALQMRESANFIVRYSEVKSFWTRLRKQIFDETEATIQRHSEVLDNLMQQF
ncbi:uncharacterized protein EDB91DRAFT_1086247 [Suillus paluster]|uniref:uncharacterized protein n=1 Tax=Suillus paluster TaxID=48578 RepID=UPI001B86C067|nr:uncharacterized protein EDB91DRAFT_1086247 [Suillus paluster]KAG1727940.1 hypothetical protein EDB91DRAFT_1086247 [Suillus paluster]